MLLPDGRVAIDGGGHPPGFGVEEFRSEIFSPPYLFKGARPTITSAPSQANYGQSFFVATPDGGTITKVALIPQPTPTHAYNSNSGYVPLTFSQTAGGLTVTGPANGNIAPPGMYMLFVVKSNGVPSVASWVRISAASQASPTALRSAGPKLLGYGSGSPTPAPAPTPPLPTPPLPTPPVPTASAPTSVFGDLTPRATVPGESFAVGSYGKRLVCTLNGTNKVTRGPPDRAPP